MINDIYGDNYDNNQDNLDNNTGADTGEITFSVDNVCIRFWSAFYSNHFMNMQSDTHS